MNKFIQSIIIGRSLLLGLALCCFSLGKVYAAGVGNYQAVPPLLSESATPLVMLALSNDHQLFYKAFTDYDDLDGDGIPENTYRHAIEYVGYYDSFKCYVYNTSNKYFVPVANTSNKYCDVSASNQWSGNFLNWATMTRMDQMRKVLFGGYRYNESSHLTKTILERSALPNDAHSFAKYYNGGDLAGLTPFGNNSPLHMDVPTGLVNNQKSGLTICNTTVDSDGTTDNSSTVSSPPLMRVVAGNFHLWNANEKWQCLYSDEKTASNNNDSALTGIYASASSPAKSNMAKQRDGNTIGDYVARVEVCNAALIGQEDCKQYPSGNYKPVGILQKFGDSGHVHFGLVTGSYAKNKSGGVVRKNVGPITDEINTTSDGSFVGDGIINTINLFRIANYDYGAGEYNATDSCPWDSTSFSNGSCTNWGNPFSEILLECYRYFAGKQANPLFDADDSTIIPGLTREATWVDPVGQANACAQLSVIAFNSSTTSYDADELTLFSDLNPPAGETAQTMTKKVGDGEGITGGATPKEFFVGEHGDDLNQLCTAKAITDLGDVRGTCPDAPRLGGSYKMAGLAFHARVNDIRADLAEPQLVRTYGVSLSPTVANVEIPVPGSAGKTVKILPACRATMSDGSHGNCGLVDFKIVQNYVATGNANEYRGSFYVNWEDNEQGGDYDMDMFGMIRYTINSTTITIETEVVHKAASVKLGFGFVVSGTTADGFNVLSGINSFSGFDCSLCKHDDPAKSKIFTIGESNASLLEQPLYYGAKWGGFIDRDGDAMPNLQEEWDAVNNSTGTLGSDGVPDTYFLAINPKQLQYQLTNILVSILERTASGTSAAVVTNTGSGEGALYQALYNPRFGAANGVDAVDWVGTLNALFIDRYGYIREDNAAPKGQLTDSDNIVDIYYNEISKKTQIQRYQVTADGAIGAPVGTPKDVLDLDPIWSAREQLGKINNYSTQRASYNNQASSGRYLLTSLDLNGDGQIGMDAADPETFAFASALFDPAVNENYRLLGLPTERSGEAQSLVNYIRGEAVTGYRNRRIDLDGDGTAEPVLLGDIVHSSPIAVGRPSSGLDLTFGDGTYREFRQKYQNRRQVVYVGANDGMLHAFNAGFFNATTSTYELSVSGETSHALGDELWAYIPYNLLPHLQWLASPSYPHVYYVDGAVKHYDVNIFTPSAKHPGGWGTILVAGMRFGGGEFTLNPGGGAADVTMRSGYVVLDITDPEQPPTVLAEISHADMGYTVAEPTLVRMRAADPLTGSYSSPQTNQWYLVFGSGPSGSTDSGREAALRDAVSEKTAKLFVYDLLDKDLTVMDTGEVNSFVGGVHSVDWTRDYIDNAIYFGTVGGTVNDPTGKLFRGELSHGAGGLSITTSPVLDVVNQPFSATPLTVRDRAGEYWVYTGTGRFYVVGDNFTDKQQSYYGIKERQLNGELVGTTVAKTDLVDTSDIKVFTDGSIDSKSLPGSNITLPGLSGAAKSFQDVLVAVQGKDGWTFDFGRYRARNITQAVVSDQSLVFSEYQPSGLKCQPEGFGFLNAPHLQAGIPGAFAPLGSNSSSTNANGAEEVNESASLGFGSPSAPSIHQRGDGKKVAVVQNSTGELTSILVTSGSTAGKRESWRELIIDWE